MRATRLTDYLETSAATLAERPAIVEPDGHFLTYAELNRQADALAGFLAASGVAPGDRVGVALPKGIPAVVSLFGVMKAGAAYVPVDVTAPAERGRRILSDCRVRAVITHARCPEIVPADSEGVAAPLAAVIVVGNSPATSNGAFVSFQAAIASGNVPVARAGSASDLAYILYTSGSTGVPKGVMLSHENAISFVDWCSSVFQPTEADRFSSHAPFHFDLSVLDLYLSVKHGASLFLIPDDLGKHPKDLARFIAERKLTIWYSTPSILTLLLQFGNLETYPMPDLRLVLFAGEVFPVKHLRALKKIWPAPIYYNLYGPTETNVCTFARIPDLIPDDREIPYPIGFACQHCDAVVLDENGRETVGGEEGLLYISGPSVFQGYWNRPAENTTAFVDRTHRRWYNTGDVVRWDPELGYVYIGRRDRMVKRRGYRVELGEIERALHTHPTVQEAAVVALPDNETGVRLTAFVACDDGRAPSIVELKTFCGTRLPAYMIPDRFVFHDRLPKTSTDKVDYQALRGGLLRTSVS